MKEKLLDRLVYNLEPENNGGEALTFKVDYYHNGGDITYNDGVFSVQEISLQSYCNSASFFLSGAITPEKLRELADLMDKKRMEIAVKNSKK